MSDCMIHLMATVLNLLQGVYTMAPTVYFLVSNAVLSHSHCHGTRGTRSRPVHQEQAGAMSGPTTRSVNRLNS